MDNRTLHLARRAGALALAATLTLTLAACGDSDGADTSTPSTTRTASNGDVFNDADVSFATEMMQHHAQALVMVDAAVGRPLDPAVQQLTEDIREAQGAEIESMTDWLTAWDQEVPSTMRDHSNAGHDMGDLGDMGGMSGMDELDGASDAEFQDIWLRQMIEHHRGAVEMAQDEQDDGAYDDAVELAQDIASSQQQEISTMEKLLG